MQNRVPRFSELEYCHSRKHAYQAKLSKRDHMATQFKGAIQEVFDFALDW